MKIKTISFKNHDVLANMDLDFTDPITGKPYHTIVIAGENGCGKTQVLEEIYLFLGQSDLNAKRNGSVEIVFVVDDNNLSDLRNRLDSPTMEIKDREVRLSYKYDGPGFWSNYKITFVNQHNELIERESHIYINPGETNRPFRVYFNEAAVGFNPGSVNSAGASTLDNAVPYRKSGPSLAQEISQLIVDIRAADNEDAEVWREANPGNLLPSHLSGVRLGRFKDAISYIFPNKKLKRISQVSGNYQVVFEEFGRESNLSQLSTGEKQIIFRGGFILRDLKTIQSSIVLIDEPELSLHPNWQARIVEFYQRLIPETATSSTQIIFATHSPFIVNDQTDAKVIILKRNNSTGSIEVDQTPSYPTTGQSEVIRAFSVSSLIKFSEKNIILIVEGDSDKTIIEQAYIKLYPNEGQFFEVRAALGHTAIRTLFNDGNIFTKNPTKKLVALFDFDSAYSQWSGIWKKDGLNIEIDPSKCLTRKHKTEKGWAMLLPVPDFRSHLASAALKGRSILPIELLFEDKDHIPGLINQIPLPSPGVYMPEVDESKKVQFADNVKNLPASSFQNFNPLFEKIINIRDGLI